MLGWNATRGTGTGTMTYSYIDGTANVAGLLGSAGIASANGVVTDRVLASQSTTASANAVFGLTLINNTPQSYTTADVSFFLEMWRSNGQTDDNGAQNGTGNNFGFLIGAAGSTDLNSTGFTTVSSLEWKRLGGLTRPAGALDGNLAANRGQKTANALSIGVWKPGQALVLRWSDSPDGGTDDIIGIDDFSFTAGGIIATPKNLVWDATNLTTGTWDATAALAPWKDADAANVQANFATGDDTTFGDTASAVTVNIPNNVTASSVKVTNTNAAGSYTFTGAGQVNGPLTKSGAGRLVLANTNAFPTATSRAACSRPRPPTRPAPAR
jgi:hypothetical protein